MGRLIKLYNHFHQDSLYRNSIYLMLSTAVMAFFGFFFWIINARLYSAEAVGIATALISVMTLISNLSLLGLGNGLIRYLPNSETKNSQINTSLTVVTCAAVIFSLLYLIFLEIFSPKLLFIRENMIFAVLFIIFIASTSFGFILENVFIAYQSAHYVLIKNFILSIGKIVFTILLISFGAYGIFMSVGIATIVAIIISLYFVVSHFHNKIQIQIDNISLKKMIRFSLGYYASVIISGLPSTIMPILIINSMGAKFSAYFYMDLMIANLLYIIPLATSQSLFAEGSYSELQLNEHIQKSVRMITLFLIPAMLAIIFLGRFILLAFGKQYSSDGIILLQLFAVSGIFISINYIGDAVLKVKRKIRYSIMINSVYTIIILGLSYLFASKGLVGIGLAWIAGNIVASGMYILTLIKN